MKKGAISGETQLVGFFGTPSKHSLSPMMHNTSFELVGINAIYLAFEVGHKKLPSSIEMIKTWQMLGANISMPNKMLATKFMDELSEAARLSGSINTIVHKHGKLIGHNTDGIGFMQSLTHLKLCGEKLTILGAGGAAISMIVQAALDGVTEIAVYIRSSSSFERIKQHLNNIAAQTLCRITLNDLDNEHVLAKDIAESKLLINATSVGMAPKIDASPIKNPSIILPELTVLDIIYHPNQTKFLREAESQGAEIFNGLDMLLYQGAEAFKLWTDQEMPIEKIKPLLKNESIS